MIIGIDGNEANVRERVGISEYAFQLLAQFAGYKMSDVRFQIYLKDEPLESLPKENENWKYRVVKPGKLWTQWRLPLELYFGKMRPDVFFSPTHYAPRFSPVPTVVSIMDLAFLYFPELFRKADLYQLRSWSKYSIKNASRVLTISNSSKNDIMKEYNVSSDKVVVTYPGIKDTATLSAHIYSMNELKSQYGISQNYILFVGTLQPRKNIIKLIEAFSQVLSSKHKVPNKETLQLVIIGKKGWLYEEILETPERLGIAGRVKFLHTVSDEDLELFYKNALCNVLPSLYEGFGLPVLEAMKQGCPVITSKISSLPEAGGDAALYIDPQDASDIAEKIVKLVSDEKLRKELIEKGKKQVARFSWENTAKQTLEVLEKVATRNKT